MPDGKDYMAVEGSQPRSPTCPSEHVAKISVRTKAKGDRKDKSPEKSGRALIDVIVEIMQRRDGKDKTLKLIQYTGKLLIRVGRIAQLRELFARYPVEAAVAPLVAELSMFRKVIKLFDWAKTMREMQKADEHSLVEWIDLYTEIMDDLYLLAKIGTIRKSAAGRLAYQADIGWFGAIILNLSAKMALSGKRDLPWKLDVSKLLLDLCFCSIDIFELNVDSFWQTALGLGSAVIAYAKIYRKVT